MDHHCWVLASISLRWHHNDHDGVSNHQPHGCLLNRLLRRRSKKTSKLRVTGLCVGNSPGPVNSPHKGPVTRKMFPFDDIIWNTVVSHPVRPVCWTLLRKHTNYFASAAMVLILFSQITLASAPKSFIFVVTLNKMLNKQCSCRFQWPTQNFFMAPVQMPILRRFGKSNTHNSYMITEIYPSEAWLYP